MQEETYKRCKTCGELKPPTEFHSGGRHQPRRAHCKDCFNASRRVVPILQTYPEVPDDFGNWLAGFIDGEGCFVIGRPWPTTWAPRFSVKLRADDAPILEEIVRRTGMGYCLRRQARPWGDRNNRPQADWLVLTKPHCVHLVQLLDRFPLRAKKARDYAIWREAVLIWATLHPGMRADGFGRAFYDWQDVPALAEQLKACRVYTEA